MPEIRDARDERGCPSEDALVDFVDGGLDDASITAIERHLDQCPRCAETVALFGGAFAEPSDGEPPPDEPPPDQGPRDRAAPAPRLAHEPMRYADRYRIDECVGAGAGGVVYRARDLELDRDIALKVLRAEDEASDGSSSARWRREAQVMARVDHPNVVTVHDVGVFGGRMFIATEFVDGGNLRAWMDERPRPWREVLEVFVAAARGLAAIHACGLVHRDFKPHNVMMGRDGRVRVTDFGLARLLPSMEATIAAEPFDPRLDSTLSDDSASLYTRTGALVGTPGYMSPEQWQGEPATPRSDQFSLCVALYEALWRHRPWPGRSVQELSQRVCETPPTRPAARNTPRWLVRAVLRGLARRPESRFESMEALIDTLVVTPRRRRRMAGGATLVVGFSTVAVVSYGAARVEPDPCPTQAEQLAGTWDDDDREQLREVLGEDLGRRASETLEPWRDAWLEHRTSTCEQRRALEIDERRHALTLACLDRSLASFRAVTGVLQESRDADRDTVDGVLAGLRAPEGCADATTLDRLEPAWASDESRRLAHELVPALERVRTLSHAGRHDEALALAQEQVQRIATVDDPAVRAAVLLAQGKVLSARQDDEQARAALEDAVWAGEAGGDVESAASGWTELVSVLPRMGRFEAAEAAAIRASAAVHRLGDPHLRLVMLGNRAVLASMQGHYEEALVQHRKVLEEGREVWGVDDDGVTRTHVNLAAVLGNLGRLDEATEHIDIALERQHAAHPDGHPNTVRMLSNLGALQYKRGDMESARVTFERALAMAEAIFDPSHPTVAKVLGNLGQVDHAEGRIEDSRRSYERMLPILREHHGQEHPDIASTLHNLAGAQFQGGHRELGLATFREALAMRERILGPDNPGTAITLQALGSALRLTGRLEEAIVLLERAHAIRTETSLDPYQQAITGFTLGRARAQAGDREAGRVLVEQARTLLLPMQPRHADLLAEVDAWLAEG